MYNMSYYLSSWFNSEEVLNKFLITLYFGFFALDFMELNSKCTWSLCHTWFCQILKKFLISDDNRDDIEKEPARWAGEGKKSKWKKPKVRQMLFNDKLWEKW